MSKEEKSNNFVLYEEKNNERIYRKQVNDNTFIYVSFIKIEGLLSVSKYKNVTITEDPGFHNFIDLSNFIDKYFIDYYSGTPGGLPEEMMQKILDFIEYFIDNFDKRKISKK